MLSMCAFRLCIAYVDAKNNEDNEKNCGIKYLLYYRRFLQFFYREGRA